MASFATADNPVWRAIALYFTRDEFKRPDELCPDALRKLYRTRIRAGVPLVIVSDARIGDAGVSLRGGVSAHDERPCTGFDVRARNSQERYAIIRAIVLEGWERFGVYPPTAAQRLAYGKNAGSIHMDDSRALPRKVCWVSV